MAGRVSRLPLRVRLVAGFSAAMLVVLAAAGAFVYWRVEVALDHDLDAELDQATATIAPLVGTSGRADPRSTAEATGAAWQVLDDSGDVVDRGGPAGADAMVGAGVLGRVGDGTVVRDLGDFLPVSAEPYRVHVTALNGSAGRYLLVGVRRDHRDEALRELLVQLTVAGLGALVLTAVVGDLLARAALQPVERYRRRAADIASGASGLRLDVPQGRDDEVTRLGHTLNDMLAALEQAMEHERRFVDDASHELRTPLTLLHSRLQLARRRTRSVPEHERILDELATDVGRLSELAEQLLSLRDSGDAAPGAADVGRVVAAVAERRRLARPAEAHELSVELPTPAVWAAIDQVTLGRLVSNLLANAFAHGSPPVCVRVSRVSAEPPAGGEWVLVQVEDAGPGMAVDLLDRATGRFTRSAEARSRPGAGLGLSLVEQAVVGAGGELRLCHSGHHRRHGRQVPVECRHGDAMTVSLLLPPTDPR